MSDDPDSESLRLHVSIGDVTIDVEGPVDEAETWFEGLREDYLSDVGAETVQAAADGSGSVSESPPNQSEQDSTTATSGKSRSLTEFYRSADNPTKKDAALIVGWYLEYHENKSDFTSSEIKEMAQDAKISLGANVSRDLSKQIESSHIEKVDERDGKDAYHLTITGERYVQDNLLGL
ncbi:MULTISPECIES: hypothetical protein [unclassified Haloferax]|uniref:hypothetical protein n=1 Tax=unclassified Haloferax TaxID=2625095 RepID=UPI000E22A71B|nr:MULTISPECIES: hypothetical protein [unclassified Haloferax]RDZ33917.1 hypothetical protein C5B88_14655 [Haloferax sp. Atlit-24N]RLM33522.1 hypothetical protein DVK03_17720 [Haloferax sp. Atlit-109R]RLM40900.1 hypothetical protein DVK04_18600 [Haloferax sp. Atlit-105R]